MDDETETKIAEPKQDVLLKEDPESIPGTAPLRKVGEIVGGFGIRGSQQKTQKPNGKKLLGWLRGISIHELIDLNTNGTFIAKAHNKAKIARA